MKRITKLNVLNNKIQNNYGFTIIELLIVIVVIGILAAITLVSYTGVTKKATEAGLTSDLSGAKKQLEMFKVSNGTYPKTVNCSIAESSTNICIKSSSGNVYTYTPIPATDPTQYTLLNEKDNIKYIITDNTKSTTIDLTQPSDCPTGFIPVPGSLTYATSGFCVMKYEAKQVGATNVPISQASGNPWVNINQTTAITNSQNVAGCTGCHLISESEWMTLAQNVLSVPSNWNTGIVGSGFIYSGHNDGTPGNSLAAAVDTDTYSGTGQSSGSQRRTLALTNGEVIWDMSGNVSEWTSNQIVGDKPDIGVMYWTDIEWSDINSSSNFENKAVFDSWVPYLYPAGTGLTNANTWNSANGIGRPYIALELKGLGSNLRSGSWFSGGSAGVLHQVFGAKVTSSASDYGFRVTR